MNILVSTRLQSSEYEKRVCEEALQSVAGLYPGSAIYRDRDIDWDGWRMQQGGHEQAYLFAAKTFDMFVLIEGVDNYGDFIARGQYTIAKSALELGKQVFVWRSWTLERVRSFRELPQKDWAQRYAQAVVERIN